MHGQINKLVTRPQEHLKKGGAFAIFFDHRPTSQQIDLCKKEFFMIVFIE